MKGFVKYCKNYILDHIDEYEGQSHYGCDLAYTLTEAPNAYSTYKAKEYLREWWDECGEYWDYEKDNFGENIHNPFDNPAAYMVCMVIEGCRAILSQVPCIGKNWNEEIIINTEVITEIKDFVNGFDENTEVF